MKKIIALSLLIAIISILTSCSIGNPFDKGPVIYTTLPEGMSGKEAASLILAANRLDSKLLQKSDSIFNDGAATLMNLAKRTTLAYASKNTFSDSLSEDALLATNYKATDGSFVEIDGNNYRWGGFTEYSNSYDYFLNLTTNISSAAKMGSELIDNVKKHVRVVDKWVKVFDEEYYLHVEENSETLFLRRAEFTEVCRRTKADGGYNVYEVARFEDSSSMRMVYSEGRICEYSYISGSFNHNFLAENNKGFWEVVDVGAHDTHYNVSCMVIKNDICYDSFYDPDSKELGLLKVVSSDRKTDVLDYMPTGEAANITLKLQGFNGFEGIEITADADKVGSVSSDTSRLDVYYLDDPVDGNYIYGISNITKGELILNNGTRIKPHDVFLDGKITVNSVSVSYSSREPDETTNGKYGGGYVPEISVSVKGATLSEQMANLNAFLSKVGLSCRRNMSYVESGILRAYVELEQFTRYHEWNESPIYSKEDLAKGWENNLKKHESYKDMYEKIKNAEVIDFSDKNAIELNIKFASIENESSTAVSNDGFSITADDIDLTVKDTMLFVENENYTVKFALAKLTDTESSDIIHIESEVLAPIKFEGQDSFTVSADVSFTLPKLGEGEYSLVAYIATADGIRSSAYKTVTFTSLSEAEETYGNLKANIINNSGSAKITVKEINEIEIILPENQSTVPYTANDVYEALAREIYEYAFVADGASLEALQDDGTWAVYAPASEDESLPFGTYRLLYNIKNGSSIKEGYVYTSYSEK